MNERIKELEKLATPRCYDETGCYIGNKFDVEKFAELIVRECADYADIAFAARCAYPGDYVAEAMGFGVEEGIADWRDGVEE